RRLREGGTISADKAFGWSQLPGIGCEPSWNQWTGISAATYESRSADSDHFRYRPRRYSDVSEGYEVRRGRIPDQTAQAQRAPGCHSASSSSRFRPSSRAGRYCSIEKTLRHAKRSEERRVGKECRIRGQQNT